ncbi:hypothetical protein BX667DRAFT_515037 [Coemansia mojavensis]|nr:hypothetical protein BX667DRAFT_515037 [Coemansia mojavensis]
MESLWLEYGNVTSEEAHLVHDLDKCEMIQQAMEYEASDYKQLDSFFNTTRGIFKHPQVRSWVEGIYRRHVSPPSSKRLCSDREDSPQQSLLSLLNSQDCNIYTPTKPPKRKAVDELPVPRKRHSPAKSPSSTDSSPFKLISFPASPTPEQPTLSLPPSSSSLPSSSLSAPATPNQAFGNLAEVYRPSGSPIRVTGTKVVTDVSFTDTDATGICKVDKSLVCKGFWDSINKAARICLPRRSGKTYNLTQLLLFFSCMPEQEYLLTIPDTIIDDQDIPQMDLATKCRLKRERLFEDSLLKKLHPKFYHEHFMKYPVLNISFSKCKGNTLGDFVLNLCKALAAVIQAFLQDMKRQNKTDVLESMHYTDLKEMYMVYQRLKRESSTKALEYTSLPLRMFESLSDFVVEEYGQYILLVDEYDIPFTSTYLAKWSKDDKHTARNIMKLLYQTMLKDNNHLIKGVLFGVFEAPLTEMGSGANNIKEIRMVPTDEKDIRASILTADCPHSRDGLDALTDSFWFNAKEVEQMLDQSTSWCAKVADYKMFIMDQIREWYNGYFIGRFKGKYNPWSVSSYIEMLCTLLNSQVTPDIKEVARSAARKYWVTTGTTEMIDAQIDRYPSEFIHMAKRLLCNYETAVLKHTEEHEETHIILNTAQLNLIVQDTDYFSESAFLTMCLYSGYLTRRLSTSVCIPNHEVYRVWLDMFARAVLGSNMADSSINYERGALLKELWQGKTKILKDLAISSHSVLSNHNEYLEKDYANHFANTIVAVSRFGMLAHPNQKSVQLSEIVPIRENHTGVGKCDYIMRLHSTHNQANQFAAIVEFKLIEKTKRGNPAHHQQLAQRGLDQIAKCDYSTCLVGCLERIDVGIAIGNNVVEAVCKLYRRKNTDSPWEEVDTLVDVGC